MTKSYIIQRAHTLGAQKEIFGRFQKLEKNNFLTFADINLSLLRPTRENDDFCLRTIQRRSSSEATIIISALLRR